MLEHFFCDKQYRGMSEDYFLLETGKAIFFAKTSGTCFCWGEQNLHDHSLSHDQSGQREHQSLIAILACGH